MMRELTQTDVSKRIRSDPPLTCSVQELRDHYDDLLALAPYALKRQASEELLAEATLSDDARREVTYRRLCAWLDLDREDARIIARAFDDASREQSPAFRDRLYWAERDAILSGLTFLEFLDLSGVVPWLHNDGLVGA